MPVEKLRSVASGRVWSGTQAKARGLVDVIGGFDDAVKIAAQSAGIGDDYKIKLYPKQKTFLAQWLQDIEENAKVKMLKQELGDGYETLQQVKNLQRYQGAQARMPFGMELK